MNKDDYILRIAQATPVQLVIITNELMVAFINDALVALEDCDTELFDYNINKAKDTLMQLIEGLDFENVIAQELYELYLYANERLNKAFFARDSASAQEILEMFQTLLEGWLAIENTPDDRIVANAPEDAPQIFAGLTYGKDGLSEYIPEDEGRGFKA